MTAAQGNRVALESFLQLTASETRSGLTVTVHTPSVQVGKKANRYANVNSKKVAVPKDCGFPASEAVEFIERRNPNAIWDFSMLEIPALDRIAQHKGIKTVPRNERLASTDADCRSAADASRPQSTD